MKDFQVIPFGDSDFAAKHVNFTDTSFEENKTIYEGEKMNVVSDFEYKYPNLSKYFLELQSQQYKLFAEKMLSYGIDNIAMGTQLENPDDIKLSLTAIWIRMNDKMNRLKNLVLKGNKNPLKDESVMDSWKDLVNYSLIAQLVSEGWWKK
jgi:hypothetical protein